jgi:hypothetical protein
MLGKKNKKASLLIRPPKKSLDMTQLADNNKRKDWLTQSPIKPFLSVFWIGFRPVIISSSTTPKLYTSLFSVSWPVLRYLHKNSSFRVSIPCQGSLH